MDSVDRTDQSQTPPASPPSPVPSLKAVESIFDAYYDETDPLNKNAYNQGKFIDKDITTNYKRLLKSIMYIIIDDLSTHAPPEEQSLNKVHLKLITAINALLDVFDTKEPTVKDNKRLVAKLMGYILSLHKIHTS